MTREMWEHLRGLQAFSVFLESIKEMRERRKEQIGAGCYMNTESIDNTIMTTTQSIGFCKGLQAVLDSVPKNKELDEGE